LRIGEWRTAPDGRRFAVLQGLSGPVACDPWPELPEDAAPPEQLRPWIDAPVFERLRGGDNYLAELRPVTSLFLKFGGIDYDGDDQAGTKLDAYLRRVQAVLQRYEGFLLQLTIGDKGSNLLAVFGAPAAHDDDPARAVAAALELKVAGPQDGGAPKIGVSQGLAWAGAVGGRLRCIYTVMGDEVNMAARLMGLAAAGQALVNGRVAGQTGRRFRFAELGLKQVKGRAEPLPVSEALGLLAAGEQAAGPGALFNTPLVGREAVLEQMAAALEQGGVLHLEGPAGVGKSHLAAVFAGLAQESGWQCAAGQGQSIAQTTPYQPWGQLLSALFGLSGAPDERRAALAQRIATMDPEWLERLPVLGDVLGFSIPDTPLSAALEPKQRQLALFSLVSAMLQTMAARQPLLLTLEDAHWFDEASLALSVAVARALQSAPALLLVVQRPPLPGERLLPELDGLQSYTQLALGDLSPAGVRALLHNRLGAPLHPLALDLIFAQAQGNPFFTEELTATLIESGHLILSESEWALSEPAFEALLAAGCLKKADSYQLTADSSLWTLVENAPISAAHLDIPDSVQGVVLARLDRLPEAHKLTIKVASIIGRTFRLEMLAAIHPQQPARQALLEQVELAGGRDFVRIETPDDDPVYIFKHNTTQEAAYNTLLFAQRRDLHQRAAEWYEAIAGGAPQSETIALDAPLAAHAALLAHHWRQAEQPAHERPYDRLAGELAAKQFANESAVSFFSRALELTPASEAAQRGDLMLAREAVNNVMGRREAQDRDLAVLEALAPAADPLRQAQIALRRAIWHDLLADYPAAVAAAQAACAKAQACDAGELTIMALHEIGRGLWNQGKNELARQSFEQALGLAEPRHDLLQQARIWYDMAAMEYRRGQLQSAGQSLQRAIDLYQRIDSRTGEITCLSLQASLLQSQGRYGPALEASRRQQALARAIGWLQMEAYGWFTSGNTRFYLGQYQQCRNDHQQALPIWRSVGERVFEAISLDTLGLVALVEGDLAQAEAHARMALELHQRLEDHYSAAYDCNHLGLALLASGRLDEAQQAFARSIQLRTDTGQEAATLDDLAGLARLALQRGDQEGIRLAARRLQDTLAQQDATACEFPVWVYLSAYQALAAAGEDASGQPARQCLEKGRALLEEQAAGIENEDLRQKFLTQVPWNRQLNEAYLAVYDGQE
jgi:tetratricopeptide (TPR) repeat protein/energy-coupling factor transporter ATP-binding protein EcfA2